MRQLPHSIEAEKAVIASLLEDSTLITRLDFLNPGDFYLMAHKEMYELMLAEHEAGNAFDLYLIGGKVTEEMGGIAYFADIVKMNPSTANMVSYARRVVELAIRRDSIKAYQETIDALYNHRNDYISEMAAASDVIDKNMCRLSVGNNLTVDDLIEQSLGAMEYSLSEVKTGVSTGIPEVDARLGYQQLAIGEITIIGAPSKNGKTLFANTIAARCELEENEHCHIFSIEMPALGMFNGIVSAMSGVPGNFYARQAYYHRVMPQKYDEWMARWGAAATELKTSGKITIDDKKDVTMQYICAEMRKQHQLLANQGKVLRVVFIDHAHRISYDTSKKPMTYAMGDDAKLLKNTASDLGVAVVLLAQINENAKERNPTSYDILDTSRLRHEMQAFIGLRIHRENGATYFGIYTDKDGLRYADHETQFHPAYMQLIGGVVKPMPEGMENFVPQADMKD